MKKNYHFAILLVLFMIGVKAPAQKVGIYSISATFSNSAVSNQTRQLVFFADSGYTASKKCKLLVMLHGQGDNPLNVITQLKNMFTRSFGTAPGYNDIILVAPSQGAQGDFYQAEDDGIIEWCVSKAKGIYNVDPLFVYISGFSLGGRTGFQMGLNNYVPYRGMFLMTPAVQNMNEAQNLTAYKYAYQNGKFIPICMTVGGSDAQFLQPVTEAQKQLQAAGAKSKLTTISGLGHNVPQTLNYYTDCYHFIEDNLNQAPQTSFAADNTIGCSSLIVQFTDQSNRAATSWAWDFGDGATSTVQNPLHSYSNPGNYTVKLTATNTYGSATNTKTSYINVGMGNAIAKIAKDGPVDSTFSKGGFYAGPVTEGNNRRLFFDVKSTIVLKTVKVYAKTAGPRTIEVLDKSGKTVKTATLTIPAGESRVTLNFTLVSDSNYAIKLALGSTLDLYRTNGGKTSYPYSISGLVSIKTSDAAVNPKSFYYYFYDWEVGYQECDNSTGIIPKPEYEGVSVFPNPSNGVFVITCKGKEEKMKIHIYNLLGSNVFTREAIIGNNIAETLDLSELAKGTYFIKISGEVVPFVRRIMIE